MSNTYPPLDWEKLASYASTPFPHGWNADEYVLFSPRDPGVHQAIIDIVSSGTHRVWGNHFGFDDDQISDLMLQKAADPSISFLLNLDKTQAGGVHEKKILANWTQFEGSMVAVGTSMHGAISHLKVTTVDGLYVISGSTNLSTSGENLQDNELRITRNALMCARYDSILALNHASMLSQMAKAANPQKLS